MFGGDFAELFQIALRRDQNAGGARHGLDNDSSNGFRTMQRNNGFQIIRKMRTPLRAALGEGVMLKIMGIMF